MPGSRARWHAHRRRTGGRGGARSARGAPVLSGRPDGQGVVVGFSPKWHDTEEAADAGFGGGIPCSDGGSGDPRCRRRSPAGLC
jgi:hypothetical protein